MEMDTTHKHTIPLAFHCGIFPKFSFSWGAHLLRARGSLADGGEEENRALYHKPFDEGTRFTSNTDPRLGVFFSSAFELEHFSDFYGHHSTEGEG